MVLSLRHTQRSNRAVVASKEIDYVASQLPNFLNRLIKQNDSSIRRLQNMLEKTRETQTTLKALKEVKRSELLKTVSTMQTTLDNTFGDLLKERMDFLGY